MAEKTALTGIVRIQAQSRLMVTPQRTAESLFVAPTPMIDPAMVWVVLTGMPSFSLIKSVIAPAVSALTPSSGVTLVMRVPIVFTIFHPPLSVPSAMQVKLSQRNPHILVHEMFKIQFMTQRMLVVNHCGADDAHHFLRIVATMPQTEQC